MLRSRRLALALVVAGAAAALSGCAGTVSLTPADDADNPLCAEVSVRLPGSVDGFDRRWTDAQATGAWGDPATVILACGVAVPGPSTLECRTVDGVDWLIDDSEAPHYRFTTYGREPAVEVFLDYDPERTSSADILRAFSPAVSQLPVTAACTPRDAEPEG